MLLAQHDSLLRGRLDRISESCKLIRWLNPIPRYAKY